jgi:hypothetical protein
MIYKISIKYSTNSYLLFSSKFFEIKRIISPAEKEAILQKASVEILGGKQDEMSLKLIGEHLSKYDDPEVILNVASKIMHTIKESQPIPAQQLKNNIETSYFSNIYDVVTPFCTTQNFCIGVAFCAGAYAT